MEITGFGGSQFPPGFRFYPTDQELIIHYMRNKVTFSQSPITSIIADVDIYKFDPWELPDKACFGEGEWFFFSPRDRKYPNGSRPNRAAASGYWKATGTDKPILTAGGSQCLGVKKSLVFYKGRPPKGIKTDWIMHEYRLLEEPNCSTSVQKQMHSMRLDDWVLCRVRHKGSIPASESQDFPNPSTNLNTKQQQEPSEKNTNMCDWIGDYNEFEYLFNPGAEGSRSGYQTSSSDDGKSPGLNEMNFKGCANNRGPPPSPPPPPPDMVSSMLNSVKRTLSVGTLDELMLMHPCKKINYCSSSVYDQFSPSQSFSIDQAFPEFTEYLI